MLKQCLKFLSIAHHSIMQEIIKKKKTNERTITAAVINYIRITRDFSCYYHTCAVRQISFCKLIDDDDELLYTV